MRKDDLSGFDQHMLLALIAPRPILLGNAHFSRRLVGPNEKQPFAPPAKRRSRVRPLRIARP
ncbi:MAG: hypothetical protein R3C42_02470 [Parvularculaceae bacterium]